MQSGKDRDKAALWDLEASRIQQPLKPVCIGCIFEGEQGQNPKHAESIQLLNRFRAVLLTDGPVDPWQQNTVSAAPEVGGKSCDSHVTCAFTYTLLYYNTCALYTCTYVLYIYPYSLYQICCTVPPSGACLL